MAKPGRGSLHCREWKGVLGGFLVFAGMLAGQAGAGDIGPAKVVRREISVALIGVERPSLPVGRRAEAVDAIGHWTRAMDREAPNRPDLFVLPEGVESFLCMTPAQKREYVLRRGTAVVDAFREYARKHAAYVVFNTYRQVSGNGFANCTYVVDRAGEVVGLYDKMYPTPGEIGWKDFPVVPGKAPLVVETDFGRIGFLTCFDLNFNALMDAYREARPDILCFCSAFHGDFRQREWAAQCQATFIGATVGARQKDVWGPCGEPLAHSQDYFRTLTVKVNTNCRVAHLDGNYTPLANLVKAYGARVEVRNAGSLGRVTVLSKDPSLSVEALFDEFGIERWSDYYARSVRIRDEAAKGDGDAK